METNKICGLSDPDRMLVIRGGGGGGHHPQLAHRQSFSVFTTTHQPTRLWKNEERKRKEWRSRFDPVGNLSGSAKLVSEKRVGSGSVSR